MVGKLNARSMSSFIGSQCTGDLMEDALVLVFGPLLLVCSREGMDFVIEQFHPPVVDPYLVYLAYCFFICVCLEFYSSIPYS